VEDGAQDWTFIQPSDFQFSRQGVVTQTWNVTCDASTDVVIFDRALTGAYARTISCNKTSGAFKEVQIAFDNEQSWYTGTGGPSSSQVDAFHIATHEFGHATGWGPHLGTSLDCDQVAPIDFGTWQTMCNSLDVLLDDPGGEAGRTFRRTTEVHDQHTFENQY
jgi:hypothetical protein